MELETRETEGIKKTVTYRELKAAMDSEISKAAESFVRIGYLFKMARDTDILQGSGYSSYLEFAQKEYGMDKSQVSRFINVHNKFADPEDPTRLQTQYQGFGYAKLALMLTLPDTIVEELTPAYSKSDIQTIKEEIDAEAKISDLEVLAESGMQEGPEENGEKTAWNPTDLFEQVVGMILDDDLYLRIKCRRALKADPERQEALIQEALAPTGEAMLTVRVKGIGRMMLSIKSRQEDLVLINVRSEEKTAYGWGKLMNAVKGYCEAHEDREEEKPPVAPVQLPGEKKERKIPKVTKAKEPDEQNIATNEQNMIQMEAPDIEPARQQEPTPEAGEGVQMDIEQYPEYLPDGYIKCHDGSIVEDNSAVQEKSALPDKTEAAVEKEKKDTGKPDPIEYDRKLLEEMIREAQQTLACMKNGWTDFDPKWYTEHSMKLRAYKLLMAQHDEEEKHMKRRRKSDE